MKMHKGFFVVLACFCSLFIFAAEGYSYTITASAGTGGYILPPGDVTVAAGADQTFTIITDLGYEIFDVVTDSGSVGTVSSYTFINVTADNSITASFSICSDSVPVWLQGNDPFNTIMEAYNDAILSGLSNFTIMLRAGTLPEEDLLFDQDVSVILDGGNNCDFTDNNMATRIPGSLTISGGTATLSNIVLSSPLLCQPGDPNNFPGNPETCDCLDNNCNGLVDDGLTFDADGDGYTAIGSCDGSADDCNDNDPNIHPYGELYGDGFDQDCDGIDVLPSEQGCFAANCHDVYVTDSAHTRVQVPVVGCGDCHNEREDSVRNGHYGQTVRTAGNNMAAGSIIRCNSCHDQVSDVHNFGANIVGAKIASDYPNVTCYTCHENLTTEHETGNAHDNRVIDSSCAECHTSDTSVLGEPGTGTLTSDEDVYALHRSDCLLCHAYTGTKICVRTVEQAIEDGLNGVLITCTDCHAEHHSPETNQVSYNPLVDTSQSSRVGCAVCHNDYDIVNGTSLGLSTWETILVEHDLDGTKDGSSNSCANCHAYDGNSSAPLADVQNAIASGNPATCATCHTDKVPDVDHGAPTTGKHTSHLEMAGINFSCSVCHTSAPYFQSGTDTNGDGLYDLAETDVCNPCHQDWDPAGLPAEQDYKAGWDIVGFTLECNDCHAEYVDNGDTIPVGGRRAVTGEFPASAHAHYGAVLDSASCQVCHDYTNHADGTVNLLDPDGGAGYDFVYETDLTTDPDLSNFCANCHDDNGATRLVLPLDPLDPFANGNAPPDVATRFMGTVQWYEYYGDSCFGYEGSQRPVNSHHDISDTDQAFSGAKIECLDCHGSHTSADSQKLTNPFFENLAWTGTLNEFCLACHNGGHDPMQPMFPTDVAVPVFYTPPPAEIPGESCGTDMVYDCSGTCFNQATIDTELTNNSCNDLAGLNLDCNIFNYDNGYCLPANTPATACGTDMFWDCNDNCVDLATLYGDPVISDDGALENGVCDEAAGLDLNCTEYNYDSYACNACIGNNCSYIGGIDSCSYGANPWYIDVTWTNSFHGADSKRDWPGYSGAPTVPEMDCVVCHDSHGSYDAAANPGGNPYMLRDYVQGSQFLDDGVRPLGNPQPWNQGTDGPVVITSPTPENIGPQLGSQFCVKCHADWVDAYSWHAFDCTGCLTCHSHGMAWGNNDWGDPPVDTQWCP